MAQVGSTTAVSLMFNSFKSVEFYCKRIESDRYPFRFPFLVRWADGVLYFE